MIEDRRQPFAAFVMEALARQAAELGLRWAERVARATATATATGIAEPSGGGGAPGVAPGEVVRAVLAVTRDIGQTTDAVPKMGRALGAAAHRRSISLHQMLEEIDCLEGVLLQAAERAAADCAAAGDGFVPGQVALAVASRICSAVSSLRLAAAKGYTQAVEDELREHYRTIRHDFRNSLGTIRSAVALLTDESLPAEMRQSSHVRAMVVRNARSLDQMIGEALGEDAASVPALGASRRQPPAGDAGDAGNSARKQRDDFLRARQRPDLESGAL